ncbi:DUF262 domain-containing HNH endonuclease family protein [Pasteurella atlantica]|uniref:DUF262 domain-containing HNH endonuclease family protein n=2 Tax=Pasteurellaceae TaxID=712 RepID=A0ACC6HMT8_9PAST|nr:DUF262 domain-containing HNH endonuclease family protein [Pasteurella atlantica]MDP8052182.1 DUF262 domain-containing HNH endonuclease family protein [Pasteurella atlantica]MDP8101217.1 DUF262 domain-containing HNH endonuclease family protein [Pasteurella atlantica]MDP8105073.1 DUF262 domain-containing HNH endonuclease family protein [Pasteurella atlantica]MDP8148558.1 DUF262 domain-containing HNH endonuclease family protein [Pasteurella atlantica]
MSKFNTEVLCLEDIVNYSFSIPTYQRPYVWEDEQIKKIIDDFYTAFESNKESKYYISTLITQDDNETKNSELIDGQQRFTTLWLISLAISKLTTGSKIEAFLKKDDDIRLSFAIRTEVYEYLKSTLKNDGENQIKYDNKNPLPPYLKNIVKALTSIENYLEDHLGEDHKKLKEFGDFIYTKVYFIKNTVPQNTDLNKLFSTINNSGVQLEQTDIVKANLLKNIDDKVLYSRIWETCENMHNFFERNARSSFPNSDWKEIDLTTTYAFSSKKFKYITSNINEKTDTFSFEKYNTKEIIDYSFNKKLSETEENRESTEVYCRSIINFGQLLLHTYRLHLKIEKLSDIDGNFHTNRLIEIFTEMIKRNNTDEIKRFFHLLWEVRYLFDKYVIKWFSDTNTKTETLELLNFSRNSDGYYTRTPYETSKSLMLQSVLYFTSDYLRQYWLSSYLDHLYYKNNNSSPTGNEKNNEHLLFLEKLDNIFSITENKTRKELSWEIMCNGTDNFNSNFDLEKYLNQPFGTNFKHYWFYKLEYLLWKRWENKDDKKFKKYRISSKNSIEHIYPQHPNNMPLLEKNDLNSFGNLVLLSVSQNSEYSNKPFDIKKYTFKQKDDYDTLKSFHIFHNSEPWDAEKIEEHKNKMIEILIEHYRK